jgi:pimeloyl-ACP methyl ester carboxylesterase
MSDGTSLRPVNSTNVRTKARTGRVRTLPWWVSGLRGGFAVLQRVSPPLAAAAADHLFFRPGRGRATGADVLADGTRRSVETPGGRVVAWHWGRGPRVYLVHGWGGRAGDFAALVPVLTRAGFSVVAFDAPAHGASAGRLSSAPQFARALSEVIDVFGPAHALVAHSLGTLATTHAVLRGLPVSRVVLIGATAGPRRWARRFARTFGLDASIVHRVRARSEKRIGMDWDELEVARRVGALDVPALLVHDAEDREVPVSESTRLAAAWPGSTLVTTRGLGHRRILRDRGVLAQVADFLGGGSGASREEPEACGHPRSRESASGWCMTCALEKDLFAPDARRLRAFPA